MEKRNRPFIVSLFICIVLWVMLFAYMPAISKGIRINKYQSQIEQAKQERSRCEQIMSGSHQKAEDLRKELNKELGLQQPVMSGNKSPSTWTQATVLLDQFIE